GGQRGPGRGGRGIEPVGLRQVRDRRERLVAGSPGLGDGRQQFLPRDRPGLEPLTCLHPATAPLVPQKPPDAPAARAAVQPSAAEDRTVPLRSHAACPPAAERLRSLAGPAARNVVSRKTVMAARSSCMFNVAPWPLSWPRRFCARREEVFPVR